MDVKIVWEYNGERGEHIAKGYDDLGHAKFSWEEHNFSCDCNRSLSFGLSEKYPDRCEDGEEYFPCGETIKVLSIEPLIEVAAP